MDPQGCAFGTAGWRDRRRGQNLAELALVLPLLLLLLLGIADLGRVFHAFIVVENAAREAARYGASYPTKLTQVSGEASAEQRAQTEVAGSGLSVSGYEYALAPENGTPERVYIHVARSADGDTVSAQVAYVFPLFSGFLGIEPITLTGTAQMWVLVEDA